MNRLEQDAADSLAAHEGWALFREGERKRWARANSGAITGVWSPPALTEQQQKDHNEYVARHNCPF